MSRSRLVQINENVIELDPRYHVFAPRDNILVIMKPQSAYFAVIDLYDLKVLQNNLDRKTIIPSIILALSNISEPQQNNGNGKKSKKSKKNGNKETAVPTITMLKFIKPRQQIQQQQSQQQNNQQQTQQQQQNQKQ